MCASCVSVYSDLLAEYRKSCSVEDLEKLKLAVCIGKRDIIRQHCLWYGFFSCILSFTVS